MSTYSSLLSPSHAHADDPRVFDGHADDGDMAAVSSYLSLDDIVDDDVAGEEWHRPLGEEEAAVFQSAQQGEPLFFATLQAEDAGYCVSGGGGEQSLPDASVPVLSSAALGNDNHDRIDLTQ